MTISKVSAIRLLVHRLLVILLGMCTFNTVTSLQFLQQCNMPVSEADATHFLTTLGILVAEHAHKLTSAPAFEEEGLRILTLVRLRLIRVCKQYASTIKPLLLGAMGETACLSPCKACASCLKSESERQSWRLKAAIDHYEQSTLELLGGDSFTAAQMSAALVRLVTVNLLCSNDCSNDLVYVSICAL
jgi:hypothetical protein